VSKRFLPAPPAYRAKVPTKKHARDGLGCPPKAALFLRSASPGVGAPEPTGRDPEAAVEGPRDGAVRDTVLVPVMGKVRVAFDADNPGRWVLHCHNLYHMATGMMTELRYEGVAV
jgi:Multicopper oxidase